MAFYPTPGPPPQPVNPAPGDPNFLGSTQFQGSTVSNTTQPIKTAGEFGLGGGAWNQALALLGPALQLKYWLTIRNQMLREQQMQEEQSRYNQSRKEAASAKSAADHPLGRAAVDQADALAPQYMTEVGGPGKTSGYSPYRPGQPYSGMNAPVASGYAPATQSMSGPNNAQFVGGIGPGRASLAGSGQERLDDATIEAKIRALQHAGDYASPVDEYGMPRENPLYNPAQKYEELVRLEQERQRRRGE